MFWTETHPGARSTAFAVGALSACAWLSLIVWDASPYSRYLHHNSLDRLDLAAPVAVAVFIGGWVVMITAMMLPTAYPVVALFRDVIQQRSDRVLLLMLAIGGYLSIWAAFGGLAFIADLGLHEVADRVGWINDHAWVVGAGVLALAGAYQFTSLKYRCLTKCRSPRMFVLRHWTGRDVWLQSFTLGTDNGLFCVGCCWSLMLVMFAAGAGSLPLMLALGAVMATEKNVSWGERISAPLGIALLASAAVVAGIGIFG